jgi:alanine racemase
LKALIDLSALQHNVNYVRLLAPHCPMIAMVKANGYGHGLLRMVQPLIEAGVDALGVACIEEAVLIRQAGFAQIRIILMEGFFDAEEWSEIIHLNLEPVIHEETQLKGLTAAGRIWIKVDTGMHRLGFSPKQLPQIYAQLQQRGVDIQGVMTHFACSDELDNTLTLRQYATFQEIITQLPSTLPISIANSGAILSWPALRQGWLRPGIMLYGVSPFSGRTGSDEGLRPVMRLTSTVIAIKTIAAGESVGYGATFVCPEQMRMGIIAVGYGDGYPRHAPNGTPVLIQGRCAPLIGRVSMDMIAVDLRAHPTVAVGECVELWGPSLPVEVVAAHMGTVGYELLTRLSVPRVPFEHAPLNLPQRSSYEVL